MIVEFDSIKRDKTLLERGLDFSWVMHFFSWVIFLAMSTFFPGLCTIFPGLSTFFSWDFFLGMVPEIDAEHDGDRSKSVWVWVEPAWKKTMSVGQPIGE